MKYQKNSQDSIFVIARIKKWQRKDKVKLPLYLFNSINIKIHKKKLKTLYIKLTFGYKFGKMNIELQRVIGIF